MKAPEGDWLALRERGLARLGAGELAAAEPILRQALTLAEQWDPKDPSVAFSLHDLAELLLASRRPQEAAPLLHRAVALLEPLGQPYGSTLASCFTHLAELLRAEGHRAEGEKLLDRAWVLMLRSEAKPRRSRKPAPTPPPPPPPALRQAKAELDRVLNLWGPGDPRVAACLKELAQVNLAQGRGAEAEAYLVRAVAILESVADEHYAELAGCLTRLAEVQRASRKAEAEGTLDRAWVLLLQGDNRQAREAARPTPPTAAQKAFQGTLYGILTELKAQRALILTHQGGDFRLEASQGIEVDTFWQAPTVSLSLLKEVALSGAPILLGSSMTDTQKAILRMSGIRSLLCVPFWSAGGNAEIAGVLYADTSDGRRSFNRQDLRRLSELARELETALH